MHSEETFLRPEAHPPPTYGISSAFPTEVLQQVRRRVRFLALLVLIAFALDLVVYVGNWAAVFLGYQLPDSFFETGAFQIINLAAVVASAGLWWVARGRRASSSQLHTLGLVYQITICFIIAMITFWQYYIVHQMLPNLTWVPAVVILFPLIMPGPPRRMLIAAAAAGAMSPLALLLLELTGKVTADPDAYLQTIVHSAIAIGFAYTGARIVYGLGQEVTAARELGSYRLVERLGQGGMGEVWRARHRLLARAAAIKLIRPGPAQTAGASEEVRRRFEREAQVIAQLRSPHTIELFDFGVAVDGAFY
jgi:eukaryotic-like serine/threonine-protein kinase